MARDTQMNVTQWLAVREAVSSKLKTAGSQQRIDTRTVIAENLMQSGYIDIDAVLAEINERQAAREKAWEDPTESEDD